MTVNGGSVLAADIRRHAELSGFPANRITQIKVVVDPSTAEAA